MKKKSLGERLKSLFQRGVESEELFEELEDNLIEADIGPRVTMEVVSELRERTRQERLSGRDALLGALKDILAGYLKHTELALAPEVLNVFLVLGVNGVGKTTTIAKMADFYRREKGVEGVVLAAGDTFRAAAIDQLELHGSRLGIRTLSQAPGADPGAVIFDALTSARAQGDRLVLADTAGRMHNRANLVAELQKIHRIVESRCPDCSYRKILVIDATTGQNGLQQAEIFHDAVGVDAVVLAKYDSTARGGILITLGHRLGLPCAFIGRGEKYGDLLPFDPDTYLDELLGLI